MPSVNTLYECDPSVPVALAVKPAPTVIDAALVSQRKITTPLPPAPPVCPAPPPEPVFASPAPPVPLFEPAPPPPEPPEPAVAELATA